MNFLNWYFSQNHKQTLQLFLWTLRCQHIHGNLIWCLLMILLLGILFNLFYFIYSRIFGWSWILVSLQAKERLLFCWEIQSFKDFELVIQIQNVCDLDSDLYLIGLDLREQYSNTTSGIQEVDSHCGFWLF